MYYKSSCLTCHSMSCSHVESMKRNAARKERHIYGEEGVGKEINLQQQTAETTYLYAFFEEERYDD